MITPLIVIYNKFCADSPACKYFADRNVHCVICDNSIVPNDNENWCRLHNSTLLKFGKNLGLPTAYNLGVAEIKTEYTLILDDDTDLPDDLYDKLQLRAENNSDVTLFMPIVLDNEDIISPCKKQGMRFLPFKSTVEIKLPVSGINSGLLIKTDYLKSHPYDSNIFLDYADHDFLSEFFSSGEKFEICKDIILHQCFFGSVNTDKKAGKKRFAIFKKDLIYYRKKHKESLLMCFLILVKRRFSV